MNDLVKRMKATLQYNIITEGDYYERGVAERQFAEAVARIEELEAQLKQES